LADQEVYKLMFDLRTAPQAGITPADHFPIDTPAANGQVYSPK
jgi:hypothetical protein